jgi:8-oxo-(d)GTP phosphatase
MAVMSVIHSAGGVVWREDGQIVIVHRDRYDDWSLPKGKLEPAEHTLAAAVREVHEETGVLAVPQIRLPAITYLTGAVDTEKVVDFWSMRAASETAFEANDEISDRRWLDVDSAQATLTYAHDRGVVGAFAALPVVTGSVVLVRHAKAGTRKGWDGDDDLRPLELAGERQAALLAPLLSLFRPVRVYAAPLTRCIDTVVQVGLPVRTDTLFAETTAATGKAVAERLRGLVQRHERLVVCSQGRVIPGLLEALRPANASATTSFATPKGAAWVLSFAGADLVAADPLLL